MKLITELRQIKTYVKWRLRLRDLDRKMMVLCMGSIISETFDPEPEAAMTRNNKKWKRLQYLRFRYILEKES